MHRNVSPIGLLQPFYITICDILFDIFIMASIVPCKELSENLTGVAAALTHNRNLENPIPLISECAVKLIDENIIAIANENAKIVVTDLLSATVQSIDPEFTVVVVQ